MRPHLHIQYQAKAQPPEIDQPGPSYIPWIYPWSEPPVYLQKYNKRMRVVQAASGLFAPVLTDTQILQSQVPWIYPWSEPKRFRIDLRRAIALAASGPFEPILGPSQPGQAYLPWYMPLSEPKRFKRGLPTHLQQFFAIDTVWSPNVNTLLQGYNWWSEPKRKKRGIGAHLQRAYFGPERLLPTPTVTARIAATETNSDIALFAINVYDSVGPITSGAGARVSITEVPAGKDAAASIRES